jgi:enterochelin esterase-like enzyme
MLPYPCRTSFAVAALLVTTVLIRPAASAQRPSERTLTLRSATFGNTRTLRVLLPADYDAPANSNKRYPVFYFTDGRAAWDAWRVPSTFRSLWERNAIPPWIVVGIDNGGSVIESKDPLRDRASEYLPYADQSWQDAPPTPRGDRFPAFLIGEVIPLVDRAFRTTTGDGAVGLAGASYGAAVALYTALRHPGRIGRLLLESPSLHIGDGKLLNDAARASAWPERVYVGVGTEEGDSPEARSAMVTDARQLHATIIGRVPGIRAHLLVSPGARHWYDAWAERLPAALKFLLADPPAR